MDICKGCPQNLQSTKPSSIKETPYDLLINECFGLFNRMQLRHKLGMSSHPDDLNIWQHATLECIEHGVQVVERRLSEESMKQQMDAIKQQRQSSK